MFILRLTAFKDYQCYSSSDSSSKRKNTRGSGSPQPGPSHYNPGLLATTPSRSDAPRCLENAFAEIDVPIPAGDSGDIAVFFNNNMGRIRRLVDSVFQEYQQVRPPAFKVYTDVTLRLVREVPDGEPQYTHVYWRSYAQVISHDDIVSYVSQLPNCFLNRFENDLSEEEGSGFVLDSIVSVKLSFSLITLHSRIGEYVPYPKGIPGKRQVFNPSGPADCVFQVITAYFYQKTGKQVTSGRQWVDACLTTIKTGSIEGPVSWEDLGVLERLNNVALRIYNLESTKDRKAELTLVRKGLKDKEVIHCLLLGNRHLALIPNLHRFMNVFTHQRRVKKIFCDVCLCVCENMESLKDHKDLCPGEITQLKFPPAGTKVKFQNYAKAYEPSYICFYDFESILIDASSNRASCVKKQHYAIAYAYIIVNRNKEVVRSGSYCGRDCVNNFIHTLQRIWKELKFSNGYNKINMTAEDTARHNEQTQCFLCKHECLKGKLIKHHDHEKKQEETT